MATRSHLGISTALLSSVYSDAASRTKERGLAGPDLYVAGLRCSCGLDTHLFLNVGAGPDLQRSKTSLSLRVRYKPALCFNDYVSLAVRSPSSNCLCRTAVHHLAVTQVVGLTSNYSA